ncbi:MAG: primosomal protein N' [Lachnospiraceae bacterium]|nr:primosomal protein N' [Lachnospiraceae bacterium]
MGKFANVVIDISHEKVDRLFGYIIPETLRDKLEVGDLVEVPFGKYNAKKEAYVIEITDTSDYPEDKMKEIIDIVPNAVSVEKDAILLAYYIKDTYGSTMIQALKTVLPAKKIVKPRQNKKIVRKLGRDEIQSLYGECIRKKQSAKARVLKELVNETIIPYDIVVSKLNVSPQTLMSLTRDGALTVEIEEVYRNPVTNTNDEDNKLILSDEQQDIVDTISSTFDEDDPSKGKFLIHGITGSGKTEVYIRLIEEAIKRNKQCIMLIPEISLSYQTLMRFYKRFKDRVSVINSSLSQGEKYDQCQRALNGDIDVIIGPRSALFTPFKNLGLVIIDEEHDGSYISESTPKYHTNEVALKLCEIKGASIVLGSATPSVDTYFRAKSGEYRLFNMTKRLTGGELPRVSIVDLKEELKEGNKSIFSRALIEKIDEKLKKKEQIMLFLNRRGYAGFISCRACGNVIKCPHCDVSLSRHYGGKLICHYCGYETKDVNTCPTCGSKYISSFKAGTEQIEEALKKTFKDIKVLRMDADTTKTKDSYEKILSAFKNNEADVLVGTQMIVKGHDFPNVTLVGVIAADLSLNEADFRTGERTFQLLTQAVGRAGRGEKEGEAIIQTYRPDHYSIIHASNQDYLGFYNEEISYRMLMDYPPCGKLLHVLIQSKDERRALGLATALMKRKTEGVRVIGPAIDSISKINDFYRYNLYVKAGNEDRIIEYRKVMEDFLKTAPLKSEIVTFDFQ